MTFHLGFYTKTYCEPLMHALSPREGLVESIFMNLKFPGHAVSVDVEILSEFGGI